MNQRFPQDKWLDKYKEAQSELHELHFEYQELMDKVIKLGKFVNPARDEEEWGMHVIDIAIKRLKEYKAKEVS